MIIPEKENAPKPISIRKNLIWNSIGCLFYQGCMWLITVLVVLVSGYEDSGVLAYAIALGNMFFSLALYNMRVYQVSDVAGENSQQNYVAFRLITIVGAFVMMAIYLFATTKSSALLIASFCMLLFKADEAMSSVYYGVEQLGGRMDYIGRSQILRGLIILIGFTSVLYVTHNLDLAIIVMAVFCIAVTFLYDRKRALLMFNVVPKISLNKTKHMFRKCFPSAVTLLFYGAVVSIARQIYEINYGEELLGIYAAIATPAVLVQVMASYLYSPFIGLFAEEWKKKNYKRLAAMLFKIIGAILGVVLLLCVFAVFFGNDFLVLLYGESISSYTHILVPTLIAVAAVAFMALFLDLMVSFRKLSVAFCSNALALLIVVLGGSPIMNQFGMNGINIVIIIGFLTGVLFGLALVVTTFIRSNMTNKC